MKSIIQSVKGTRDFYPEDMSLRIWLYDRIREVSESFGYREYDAPFLEKIDLYAAKSGEELVKEQSFVFPDRSGELIALRPELTPSLARMVAQRQGTLVFPLRWWSYGPFWRYERPQKGRTREFFQWNIDLIGGNSPELDAELVGVCASFFKKVGLSPEQVVIRVNDRKLMESELRGVGIDDEKRKDVFRMIDRRDKMSPQEWETYGLELGLTNDQLAALKALLADRNLWERSETLPRFFSVLDAMGLRAYVEYDAGVIRGLEYYTGLVFEAYDRDGGRAVLGGGHYDNLVGDVGGDPLPGVGFAMGDVMVSLVLKSYNLAPEYQPASEAVLVTVFDEGLMGESIRLATELRQAGLQVVCGMEASRLQKQLKFADRLGIGRALIIGPDEVANNLVTIKDLTQRTQLTVKRCEVVSILRGILAEENGV